MMVLGSTTVVLVVTLLSATAPTSNSFVPPVPKSCWQEHRSPHVNPNLHQHTVLGSTTGSSSSSSSSSSIDNTDEAENEEQKNQQAEENVLGRRESKRLAQKQDYERRRDRWMSRYGSAEALTSTFGPTKKFGGDLSPTQTRALYHTLLPRSLLGLHELGVMNPEELAPLAYEARIAAKDYARSRCVWTGRLVTAVFDQYRSLRDRGRLATSNTKSMSWDEIWEKYEGQIVQDECTEVLRLEDGSWQQQQKCSLLDEENQETLAMRIYLRILEKSCATNQAFDNLFLKKKNDDEDDDGKNDELAAIAAQLEEDVRSLLLTSKESEKVEKTVEKIQKEDTKAQGKEEKRRQKAQEEEEKERVKSEKKQTKADRKDEKKKRKLQEKANILSAGDNNKVAMDESLVNIEAYNKDRELPPKYSKRFEALRIMGGSRRKFQKLFHKKPR
jgi:hypothetical protein